MSCAQGAELPDVIAWCIDLSVNTALRMEAKESPKWSLLKTVHCKQFLGSAHTRTSWKMEFLDKNVLSHPPKSMMVMELYPLCTCIPPNHLRRLRPWCNFCTLMDFSVLIITLGRESPWITVSGLMRKNRLSRDKVIYSQGQDQFTAHSIPLWSLSTSLD